MDKAMDRAPVAIPARNRRAAWTPIFRKDDGLDFILNSAE
jgi:hypothetical protein